MVELVHQFLFREIVRFGVYSVSVLDVLLVVPIVAVDVLAMQLLTRFLKKRGHWEKGVTRAAVAAARWLIRLAALLAVMKVLGIELKHTFEFVAAVLGHKLFTVSDTHISLLTIIVTVLVVWISAKLAKLVRNYMNRNVFPRFKIDEGIRFSLSKMIGYLIVALGVVFALQGMGVKLSALAVFVGFLGVGIGFGLQSIVANIISGFIILFERPIKEGDTVRLHNMTGVVNKINLRSSVVRTTYNEHLIVPNSEFINNTVENMSYGDLRLRVSVKVGVAYGTDPNAVKNALIEAARKTAGIMESPEPAVLFRNFGDSALEFELLAWIEKPSQRFHAESDLRFTIVETFAARRVAIPFPQRDVWIKSMPPGKAPEDAGDARRPESGGDPPA